MPPLPEKSQAGALPLRLATHAMATRFELVLPGENKPQLRSAGEEALFEIHRLEQALSLYLPTSEISQVNAAAGRAPIKISSEVFGLLQLARSIHEATAGTFDPTVGPLTRCWGFMENQGRLPSESELEAAKSLTGMNHLLLEETGGTAFLPRAGMMIDLGAIGKGYAIDQAVLRLREAGIESALLHGGTSTIYALGAESDEKRWRIGIPDPLNSSAVICEVELCDESLSLSAINGRSFEQDKKNYGHILDPRSGRPVDHTLMSALISPSATESDALSTALLTLGIEAAELVSVYREDARWLLATRLHNSFAIHSRRFPGLNSERKTE